MRKDVVRVDAEMRAKLDAWEAEAAAISPADRKVLFLELESLTLSGHEGAYHLAKELEATLTRAEWDALLVRNAEKIREWSTT